MSGGILSVSMVVVVWHIAAKPRQTLVSTWQQVMMTRASRQRLTLLARRHSRRRFPRDSSRLASGQRWSIVLGCPWAPWQIVRGRTTVQALSASALKSVATTLKFGTAPWRRRMKRSWTSCAPSSRSTRLPAPRQRLQSRRRSLQSTTFRPPTARYLSRARLQAT